jgi:hypothetical protein
MPRCETPTMPNKELKVLHYSCLGGKLEPSSSSRDSGLVISRFKVFDLRDRETSKNSKDNTLAKNGPFVSDKALLFRQQKFFRRFMTSERKGKEKQFQNLSIKVENLREANKTKAAPT